MTNDGTAAANAGDGIDINGANNTVGGSAVADRNVVSANNGDGVHVVGDGNTVQNDRVGIAPGSPAALGNILAGVEIEGDDNTVGDSEIGDNGPGIKIKSGSRTMVLRNRIGTATGAPLDLGNNGPGVETLGDHTTITGT